LEDAYPGPVYTDEIIGGLAVHEGNARHVRGVVAKGSNLIIRLVKPDGAFLSKITMPVFQATSTKLPLTQEVTSPYPTAGPYAFTRNHVNVLTSIRRNRYWKRGPGRQRPRNVAGVDVLWGLNEQTEWEQLKAGELDEISGFYPSGIPEYHPSNFRSEPQNCTGYLPMNMANPLFKNNLPLRQAVNYAINRGAYVAQAGPYAGRPWTHILDPGVPGWRNVTLYKRNLAKARRLAAGHLRDGKITMYYWSTSTANQNQAMIVRQDLINIGFQPENITVKGYSHGIYDPITSRGTEMDIAVSRGWCSDYAPDPYDLINVLFDGNTIQAENNTNTSYMNLPKWNRRMEAAAKLVGPKRFKAYGQLDLDLMREVAPVAVERTYNNRYFFSNRVDLQRLVYQGIYSDWSIPALALK
jgi:peptide/nickel transport system substrate-binding protein